MIYNNQKKLIDLIDQIVINESQEMVQKKIDIEKKYQERLEEIKKLKDKIYDLTQKNTALTRNIEVIRKHEEINQRYFIVSGHGDVEIVGIDVIEITKDQAYPTINVDNQIQNETQDDDLPF